MDKLTDQMDAATLRAIQAPLKESYKNNPATAIVTLHASATLDEGISCKLSTGKAAHQVAGLHELAGGKGDQLCSGDMLLEALVACTGVTLRAVATSMEIPLASGTITVEGDLNFACVSSAFPRLVLTQRHTAGLSESIETFQWDSRRSDSNST